MWSRRRRSLSGIGRIWGWEWRAAFPKRGASARLNWPWHWKLSSRRPNGAPSVVKYIIRCRWAELARAVGALRPVAAEAAEIQAAVQYRRTGHQSRTSVHNRYPWKRGAAGFRWPGTQPGCSRQANRAARFTRCQGCLLRPYLSGVPSGPDDQTRKVSGISPTYSTDSVLLHIASTAYGHATPSE